MCEFILFANEKIKSILNLLPDYGWTRYDIDVRDKEEDEIFRLELYYIIEKYRITIRQINLKNINNFPLIIKINMSHIEISPDFIEFTNTTFMSQSELQILLNYWTCKLNRIEDILLRKKLEKS